MKIETRKNLSTLLGVIGAVFLVAAQFVWSSWWPIIVALYVMSAALLFLALAIAPPFWWGNRSFTTPVNDPLHVRRHDET